MKNDKTTIQPCDAYQIVRHDKTDFIILPSKLNKDAKPN